MVYDAAGKAVAAGVLGQGAASFGTCWMPFAVAGVPVSSGLYALQVNNRRKASGRTGEWLATTVGHPPGQLVRPPERSMHCVTVGAGVGDRLRLPDIHVALALSPQSTKIRPKIHA